MAQPGSDASCAVRDILCFILVEAHNRALSVCDRAVMCSMYLCSKPIVQQGVGGDGGPCSRVLGRVMQDVFCGRQWFSEGFKW